MDIEPQVVDPIPSPQVQGDDSGPKNSERARRAKRRRPTGRRHRHNRFDATKKTVQEHVRLLKRLHDSLCDVLKVSMIRHEYPPQLTQDIRIPPYRPRGKNGAIETLERQLATATSEAERKKLMDAIRKHRERAAAHEAQYQSLVEIHQAHHTIRLIIHDCQELVAKCHPEEADASQ